MRRTCSSRRCRRQRFGGCAGLPDAVGRRELHQLSLACAGEIRATDVLSFAQRDPQAAGRPPLPAGVPEPPGDITSSRCRSRDAAAAQGHDLLHELLHLAVHGFIIWSATITPRRRKSGYVRVKALLREQARRGRTGYWR